MKINLRRTLPALWLAAALLSGCGQYMQMPTLTPDLQATVDAAIAATAQAQDVVETTPTETVTAEAASAAQELTEEELALLIENQVDATLAASQELEQASSQASADGNLDADEAAELQASADELAYSLEVTQQYVDTYYGVYGELAQETLLLLEALDDDLQATAEVALEMVELMAAIEDDLGSGAQVATETLEQLDDKAAQAQQQLLELKEESAGWRAGLQAEISGRLSELQGITPSEIPASRIDAILGAFAYIDAVRAALGDRQLDWTELQDIGQLGANAMAGLESYGGPRLQTISGDIGQITDQLARGQFSGAVNGLGALEDALGARPGP